MDKKKIEIFLVFVSIGSLILLYFCSNFEYKEISNINECCEGKIKIKLYLEKTFYSKKGKYFGKSKNFLVYLDKYRYISNGDVIYIFGKGNLKNNTCFIFPDKITILDVKE